VLLWLELENIFGWSGENTREEQISSQRRLPIELKRHFSRPSRDPSISLAPQGSTRILLKSKKFVNRIAQINRTIEETKDGSPSPLASARVQSSVEPRRAFASPPVKNHRDSGPKNLLASQKTDIFAPFWTFRFAG
jgi:hypothetical protein